MEKIFYYRHTNNEIYELKFKSVCVQLGGRVAHISKNKFYVEYVEAEVAGLGLLRWARYGTFRNSLSIVNIYDTIEKAMRGYNTNSLGYKEKVEMHLREEDLFKVNWHEPWDCSNFNLNFILPNHIFAVKDFDVVGCEIVRYHTWVWDGIKPKEKGCLGTLLPCKNVPNSYQYLWYDLVSGECLYNKEIVGYATREECARANSVKIHRF